MKDKEKYSRLVKQFLDLKQEGLSSSKSFEIIQNLGYDKELRTLYRQIAKYEATGHVFQPEVKNNREPLLNSEKLEMVKNWIIQKNSINEDIQRKHVQKYIYDTWAIRPALSTISSILKKCRMSRKTCQVKTPGHTKPNAQLKAEYWDFIREMKKKNLFSVNPSNIRSIDVIHVRKPTQKVTTYSPIGSSKQRSKKKVKLYTDAIVTMISADGLNRTPCKLYTHNPRMAPTQKNTIRGRQIRQEFTEALQKFNIDEKRIVYKKSTKNMYGECPEVYEDFLSNPDIPRDILLMHDGGNAFKRKKVSILESMGFRNHVVYPSSVHQWLSPNDNNLHGVKTKLKEEYYDFEDQVSISLRLMQLIDSDTLKNSKKYFKRNLIHVKKTDLDKIVGL